MVAIVLLAMAVLGCGRATFESAAWKRRVAEGKKGGALREMAEDAAERRLLLGLSRSAVLDLLGPHGEEGEGGPPGQPPLEWVVEECMMLSCRVLEIHFDGNGMVTDAWVSEFSY